MGQLQKQCNKFYGKYLFFKDIEYRNYKCNNLNILGFLEMQK